MGSHRVRTDAEAALLRDHGHRIVAVQLQGNLTFAATAAAAHEAQDRAEAMDFLVLDFAHVLSINVPSARLLYELTVKLSEEGKTVLFTHPERIPLLGRVFRAKCGARVGELFRTFEDNDPALGFCEERLLQSLGVPVSHEERVALSDCELLEGFTTEEIAALEGLTARRTWFTGETLIEVGADELIILESGRVSVLVGSGAGRRRLATFSPGMAFGEMALIDRSPRSATIVADTPVTCRLLSGEAFAALGSANPGAKIKLLENLARGLSRKLRKANVELGVFE